MKKKTQLLSLLLVLTMLLAFVPAGAQAADETPYDLRVLTFEDADYKGGTNFAGGSDWTSLIDDPQYGGKLLYGSDGVGVSTESEAYKWTDENNTMLSHVFPYNYEAYCYWGGGHAISNYASGDIADYGGFNTQLTVYKKGVSGLTRTGAGHNGSDNFAVHYGYIDGSEYNKTEVLPAFSFADGVERVVDHMYITNTTYALNCYIDGNGLTAKIGDDDWVKVVAIGYDINGEKTGETNIYLCNGPDDIVMDWTKWDLSVLGKVLKVAFNVTGSNDNGYGFSQPAYFAYDDVAVRFEKDETPVSSVLLSQNELTLTEGNTATLTATVAPDDADNKTVTWSTSAEAVATVENGVVTAVHEGTAVITATAGGKSAACTVTVKAPAVPLEVTSGSTKYNVRKTESPVDGESAYYVAVPYGTDVSVNLTENTMPLVYKANDLAADFSDMSNPINITAENFSELILTDKQVAKLVKFTPAATSKVAYVRIMDAMAASNIHVFFELTNAVIPVTAVTLNKNTLEMTVGDTAALTAMVYPATASDKTVTWTSSAETVATVENGTITALAAGTAVIKASAGDKSSQCAVTVKEKPAPLTVTADGESCAVSKTDGPEGSTSYYAAVPVDSAVSINMVEITMPLVYMANSLAADFSDMTNPINITSEQLKTLILTDEQAEKLLKFTPGEGNSVAYLRIMDGMNQANEVQLFLELLPAEAKPEQDENGVYQISTADELVWFAEKVNSGKTAISAVLTKDIDLTGINWTPIGGNTVKFGGTFDGAGHVIQNLSVDYATKASGERVYLGLFGCVEGTKDAHAVIKNFTVSGRVTAKSDYSVYSGNIAGVVADGKYLDLSSIVSRVAVNADENTGKACGVGGFAGTLVDCIVTDCGSEGNVSGVKNIGGFCYELYAGTMTGCYNTGSVTAAGSYVGGIMGYAKNATIQNVYNRGAVSTAKNMVGGLVGVMEASTVTNAYTTGTVTVAETGGTAVGAAIGWAGTVSNVYYLEGTAEKGIGRADDTAAATAEAKTADQMQTLQGALGDYFKADTSAVNGGYPVLQWQPGDAVETTLTGIRIAKAPARTEYTEGEDFDAAGMVVMAVYSDGNEKEISDYAIENGEALTAGMTSVTVKYGDFTAEQSVTVTKKDVKAEYTLTMAEDKTVSAGDTVALPVALGHTADETTFHAADITFTYDTAKLTYNSVTTPDNNCIVTENNGTIRVLAYGDAKNLGAAVFTLNFTAKADASGAADVKVTSAKIDKSANAVAKDAPEAQLEDDLTVITIKATHSVTLPDIFDGEKTVEDGADYTFSKTDKDESHYEYTDVKATVDGNDVEVVDNGDGTYAVKNVTGDLTVTGTRTAKKYKVTVDGNAKSCIGFADTASYGTDYDFTASNLETDKYDYTLTMTIGGKSHTPEFDDWSDIAQTYVYKVKGEDIVGDIHITFTQKEKAAATTQITFEGSGVSDVQGGNPQSATTGADFTFTVNEDANYDYTVKLGDEVLTGTNGSYTIPGAKITGTPLTVTVEKTFGTKNVNVQKYVNLENQTSVWLVTVEAEPGTGNVFTYGGEKMFKTTKYGTNGTYAYLVIAPALSVEDAAAQLGIMAGEAAGTVSYGGDVNGSTVIDINDAQLVYDLYNAHYSDFTTVSMYKFLCADIADNTPEGSTLLNVSDAVAVIDKINK